MSNEPSQEFYNMFENLCKVTEKLAPHDDKIYILSRIRALENQGFLLSQNINLKTPIEVMLKEYIDQIYAEKAAKAMKNMRDS